MKIYYMKIYLKHLLYHEDNKNQTKFSFDVIPSVILFTGEIIFQYHFTNLFNLVTQ